MENKRVEVAEEALETVIGGQICYTWDNDTSSGEIWVTSKNPVKYRFTNYSVVQFVGIKQEEGYSDYEIMDLLKDYKQI